MPTAEFTTLLARADGAVGHLTLNRPEKLNPLGTATLLELAAAARWFDEQTGVKAVVVGGRRTVLLRRRGPGLLRRPNRQPGPERPGGRRRRAPDGRGPRGHEAVTVAAIHGHCIGGGVVLAAACDLRVAADDTYFSIPEVDLGIPLAWGGIPRLVREIGPALTRELVLTCRPFSAAEAQAFGFLNRVVPADQVRATAEELADQLSTKSRLTLTATKRPREPRSSRRCPARPAAGRTPTAW